MTAPETTQASTEAERLREAIKDMNELASHGFTSVAAIARLARLAMEQPEERRPLGDIRAALLSISSVADDVANSIDVTAETAIGTRQDSVT